MRICGQTCATRLRYTNRFQLPLTFQASAPSWNAQQQIWSIPSVWTRGAKKVSSTMLSDLPQGGLPRPFPQGEPVEEDSPIYPTVIQQALNNMRTFSHCIVLTRVGSFYEMYFHQAEEYATILNLKLAKKRTNAGEVSMMGFPFFQLDRYLKILVQDMQKYVAISEEFPNDPSARVKSGGLLFDRRVARVITPGTLIDEKFMDPSENNYILSIFRSNDVGDHENSTDIELGLAWADLSSGDHFTQNASLESLPSALARIGPREIIVALKDLEDGSPIASILQEGHYVVSTHDGLESIVELANTPILESREKEQTFDKFTKLEMKADEILLQYVQKNMVDLAPQLRFPIQCHSKDIMMIDKNSLRALEIKSTLKEDRLEGSLLHTVKRTVTNSGYRLLSQRLSMKMLLSRYCVADKYSVSIH